MAKSSFESDEVFWMIISIAVLGFCFSFREWGVESFSVTAGITSFVIASFLVGISFIFHEIIHRKVAKRYSAKVKFRAWPTILITAIIICFLTNGLVVFAAVGGIIIFSSFRPGYAKPHLSPHESAKIAASGPLANITLAILAAIAFSIGDSLIFYKLMIINIWLACFNLFPFFRIIPILMSNVALAVPFIPKRAVLAAAHRRQKELPYVEGEIVFHGSRPLWVFSFSFVLICSILLYIFKNAFAALSVAFLLGFILYLAWHFFVEPWSYQVGIKKPKSYPKMR